MHKNEALPCPARLDPASHPVETVGTRRVALGYANEIAGRSPQGHERMLIPSPIGEIFFASWGNIFS